MPDYDTLRAQYKTLTAERALSLRADKSADVTGLSEKIETCHSELVAAHKAREPATKEISIDLLDKGADVLTEDYRALNSQLVAIQAKMRPIADALNYLREQQELAKRTKNMTDPEKITLFQQLKAEGIDEKSATMRGK